MGRIVRTLIALALLIGVGFLANENSQPIVLRFVGFESREWPLWAFLLVAVGIGIVIGWASVLADYVRVRRGASRQRRRGDEATRRAEEAERRAEEAERRAEEAERRAEEAVRASDVPRGRPGGLPADVEEIRADLDLVEDASPESTAVRRVRPPGELD